MQSIEFYLNKFAKAFRILSSTRYIGALAKGVAASVEHEKLFRNDNYSMIIDIGANRGQFALVARRCFPEARIISFEPLTGPTQYFNSIFSSDKNTKLIKSAIGRKREKRKIHISNRDDSSSLLPISNKQIDTFPGTETIESIEIDVHPLTDYFKKSDIQMNSLLKIDVQGFELEVLNGCSQLIDLFDSIYCECSFIELYSGQPLAKDIINWLNNRNFHLRGVYNTYYDKNGTSVQADFYFGKTN